MFLVPYELKHKDGCLAAFDSNTPPYFHPIERPQFEAFLDGPKCPYFVLVEGEQVLGCGGWYEKDGVAGLVWGMIHADHHRKGLGTTLLRARFDQIHAREGDIPIRIETTEHAQGFFEKHGFVATGRKKDGFGEGLDQVDMVRGATAVPG